MQTDISIPMADGVRLSADLYAPEKEASPGAAILIRTPYGKSEFRTPADRFPHLAFVQAGYRVLVVDLRGCGGSEGEFRIAADSRTDGLDLLDWICAQPWCDGSVGAWGCSYLGETQVYLAAIGHPALKAVIPIAAGGALGSSGARFARFGFRQGGVAFAQSMALWFAEQARAAGWIAALPDRQDWTRETVAHAVRAAIERRVPTMALMKAIGIEDDREWRAAMGWEKDDARWRSRDYLEAEETFHAPALIVDSWYDPGVADSFALRDHVRAHGAKALVRESVRMIVAPTCHCRQPFADERTLVGEREMGDARLDYTAIYLAWFDRWLRRAARSVEHEPQLLYFLMGAGEWRSAADWPPPGQVPLTLYLHSDTRLATEVSANGTVEFEHDTADPRPTVGGAGFSGGEAGALDQRRLAARTDAAIFTSAPLTRLLDVVGRVSLTLHVSAPTDVLDLHLKLVDVEPNGRAFNLIERAQRIDHPFQPHRVTLDLGHTAVRLGIGHRIELQIAAANYPAFELSNPTARFRVSVHLGPEYPACVILDTVPE